MHKAQLLALISKVIELSRKPLDVQIGGIDFYCNNSFIDPEIRDYIKNCFYENA